MELFSEIYGCYYTVVTQILEQAQNGLTKDEIEKIVSTGGFYESTIHLLPSLFSGEWNLLQEKGGKFYGRLNHRPERPYTVLEKAWLKSLLSDPRIRLFLDEEQWNAVGEALYQVEPLFYAEDLHEYDKQRQGDMYADERYIERFRLILTAMAKHKPIIVEYEGAKGGSTKRQYHPYRLCYSPRDDKFRLQCGVYHYRQERLLRNTLNLARIISVEIVDKKYDTEEELKGLFREAVCKEPVLLQVSTERNGLERSMLQFASFERQTEYDREKDVYYCRIWYDPSDETELLIRVLSFGPVIKVLGSESFLKQIRLRIAKQVKLNN